MHRIFCSPLIGLGALLLGAGLGTPPARGADALPTATAGRVEGPIQIDGKLDEPFWNQVPVQSEFHPLARRRQANVLPDPTEFRIAFDGQAILLGITCHQSKMEELMAGVTQRDGPVWSDDGVEIFLRHNDRFYYHFAVNAAATRFDLRAPVKSTLTPEAVQAGLLWDGVWQAAVQRLSDRWTVEVRIPLATLEMEAQPPARWRLNVGRHWARANFNASWAPVKMRFNELAFHGYLRGIDVPPGQFPLDAAALEFPPLLIGKNRITLKLPAARTGPYRLRAQMATSDQPPHSIEEKTVSAADGVLSADLTLPVPKAGVTHQLTLQIDDAQTDRPLVLRAHLFRAPDPLEASMNWPIYYSTDAAAEVTTELAVAGGSAKGEFVTTMTHEATGRSAGEQRTPIQSAGEQRIALPLGDLPEGLYRLKVTAKLPELGDFSRELWFQKVPGPFEGRH